MEGQEKRKPSLAELYHAVVRAVGTLLPPGEERKRPAVRLEGGGLEGEMSLKRKRLSPATGKSLRKTLSRHPEGTAVGLTLWPRTREGRLDLAASQVGHLYIRPKTELAGTFSVLGLPKSWEPGEGRLVLEVRPNREGILPKPFALELLVPPALRPSVPPVGEEEALRVQDRVVEDLLVVEEAEKVPRPPEREGGAAKGDDPPPGRRRRERAGPGGGAGPPPHRGGRAGSALAPGSSCPEAKRELNQPQLPSAGGADPPSSRKCAFVQGWRPYNQRPRTGQVRRRAHFRRAPGKGAPPHGRWGGVGRVDLRFRGR
jgi:hypothetical protein